MDVPLTLTSLTSLTSLPPLTFTISDKTLIKPVKSALEAANLLDKARKVLQAADGKFVIHATNLSLSVYNELITKWPQLIVGEYTETLSPLHLSNEPKNSLAGKAVQWLRAHNYNDQHLQSIVRGLPRKYSLYPPMMLASAPAFHTDGWALLLEGPSKALFFDAILPSNITHVAVNVPINEHDSWRKPTGLLPIHGDFGKIPTSTTSTHPTSADFENAFWCSAVQNGILQYWAPYYTMFLRGNIKEKARLLSECKDCRGKAVFDLYCGIGYFSLCYLKNQCKVLLCWELNPWSIRGFERALKAGKYRYRTFTSDDEFNYDIYLQCIDDGIVALLFNESNENARDRLASFPNACLDIAHVNLGLLPSSQLSWPIVRDTLGVKSRSPSFMVHVHENVHLNDISEFAKKATAFYGHHAALSHIEKVKTFAPDIWHIVVDVKVLKNANTLIEA